MKDLLKSLVKILMVFVVFLLINMLVITYHSEWKVTEVGKEISPTGEYHILFQEKGEPFLFGPSHAIVMDK